MKSFRLDKPKKEKVPSKPPYWYQDLKELMWWLLGVGLIILVMTRM